MLRQSLNTYDLFFFINADERRKKDVDWKVAYSVAILPLIRCMIDCLYNITLILAKPVRGYQFRESGFKLALDALDADEKRYGGHPKWDTYIAKVRAGIYSGMQESGITVDEVKAAKIWPTLSAYLRFNEKTPFTAHQQFLKKLTYGFWQEYSGMAHATFQGLMPTAIFYIPDNVPYEQRANFETVVVEQMIAIHVSRAAAILLCMLTEVQAHFRFDGAHINERLHQVWNALVLVPEIKELYDERYANLMQEKGIHAA